MLRKRKCRACKGSGNIETIQTKEVWVEAKKKYDRIPFKVFEKCMVCVGKGEITAP